VSWPQEFSRNARVKLRVHLDQWPTEDPKELIRTAVHNHFTHLAQITDLEFKRLLKQGRTSLFIGPLFLAACLFLSKMLVGHDVGTWAAVVRGSLTIAVGSLWGDRCRSSFTIGGLCCDGVVKLIHMPGTHKNSTRADELLLVSRVTRRGSIGAL
jgi:hypothetical protein